MNLISFPHYTCGGLLCDILNGTFSTVDKNGGISSISHSVGKIGDSADIFENFDSQFFFKKIQGIKTNTWVGTHCWLGNIDLSKVNQVINVTTETYRSKLYRWVRAYHHYYLASDPWQGLSGIKELDKQRETAKNYLKPFLHIDHDRVINIEFSDVVEAKPALFKLVPGNIDQHLGRWRQINSFLYSDDIWSSKATIRFHEAEYEVSLAQSYLYE